MRSHAYGRALPHGPVTGYKNGILTRGVRIDIPRMEECSVSRTWRGYLSPGPGRLGKENGNQGTQRRCGLYSKRRWTRRQSKGPWDPSRVAGLYASCAKWLKQRDVAMVGSDAATDVMPSRVSGVVQPMHQLLLIAMGMPNFDNCDLEELAVAAAARNRWTFLLTAAPLPVPGGTGSPLNPIATF